MLDESPRYGIIVRRAQQRRTLFAVLRQEAADGQVTLRLREIGELNDLRRAANRGAGIEETSEHIIVLAGPIS